MLIVRNYTALRIWFKIKNANKERHFLVNVHTLDVIYEKSAAQTRFVLKFPFWGLMNFLGEIEPLELKALWNTCLWMIDQKTNSSHFRKNVLKCFFPAFFRYFSRFFEKMLRWEQKWQKFKSEISVDPVFFAPFSDIFQFSNL